MTTNNITEIIGKEKFESEVKNYNDKPVLVDFWAPWCGPCKQLAPLYEDLAKEYNSKVKFVKVNVDQDDNKPLAAARNVRGIPSIMLFKNGEPKEVKVGKQNKDQYKDMIEKYT